jgi:hypothetical protein
MFCDISCIALERLRLVLLKKTVSCSGQDISACSRVYSDWATGWMIRGSNPGADEISVTRLDPRWGPPSLLYSGYRVFLPEVKRPGRGFDHPPLSRAEVKEWSMSLLPLWDFVAGYKGCGFNWS